MPYIKPFWMVSVQSHYQYTDQTFEYRKYTYLVGSADKQLLPLGKSVARLSKASIRVCDTFGVGRSIERKEWIGETTSIE